MSVLPPHHNDPLLLFSSSITFENINIKGCLTFLNKKSCEIKLQIKSVKNPFSRVTVNANTQTLNLRFL